MGKRTAWTSIKKASRAVDKIGRDIERSAVRQQRETERQQKAAERMEAIEQAAYEVEQYNNQIESLLLVHTKCKEEQNWAQTKKRKPPIKPQYSDETERTAQAKLDTYKPGFFDRIFKREDKVRSNLAKAVEVAKSEDKEQHELSVDKYKTDLANHKESKKLAEEVLAGKAKVYLLAIKKYETFKDIEEFGILEFQADKPNFMEATLNIKSEQIIPREIKTQLKSGKLSIKEMPKTKFNELYLSHVCSCLLRVARELFALLPIEWVFVHAQKEMVNPQNGHMEQQIVLSSAIPRPSFKKLNFKALDCEAALNNFIHNMKFNKTKGFTPVEALKPQDFVQEQKRKNHAQ